MARWRWWCAMVLVSGCWLACVASAADREALFAEGTLTSVDLSQEHPTITLRRSAGPPLILRLGRIGAWEGLEVGAEVKLRYTEQGGTYTIESMEIVRPVEAAASASPGASPSPVPSLPTVVEQPSAPSQAGREKPQETTQETTQEKKKKKP